MKASYSGRMATVPRVCCGCALAVVLGLAGAGMALAQTPDPTPTPAPGGSGGGGPSIDIGGLVDGIVNGIRDVLTSWAAQLVDQFLTWLRGTALVWLADGMTQLW